MEKTHFEKCLNYFKNFHYLMDLYMPRNPHNFEHSMFSKILMYAVFIWNRIIFSITMLSSIIAFLFIGIMSFTSNEFYLGDVIQMASMAGGCFLFWGLIILIAFVIAELPIWLLAYWFDSINFNAQR